MLITALLLIACGRPPHEPPPATTGGPPGPALGDHPGGPGGRPGGPGGPGAPVANIAPTATVTNPTSGAKLAVYLSTPTTGTGPFPALVIVPGGFEPGLRTMPEQRQQPYLQTGFALVIFDPDGRGQSTGTEDRGGKIQQDGLAAVIDWAAKDSRIDPNRIGLASFSFGVTMAAGVLANHPTTPVKFLLDWEGPANRNYTHDCNGAMSNVTKQPQIEQGWGDCKDDAWWADREASTNIGKIRVPYQRVQFARDHNQPTHQHTIDMITAAEAGGVPWVRLNDEEVNKKITSDADFTPISNNKPMHLVVEHYAKAMMEMTTKQPVVGNEPPMIERPEGAGQGGRPGGPGGGGGRGGPGGPGGAGAPGPGAPGRP